MERNGNDSNVIDLNALETNEDSSFFEVNNSQTEICAKNESKNLIDKEKSYTQKKPSKIGRKIIHFFLPKPKVVIKCNELSDNSISKFKRMFTRSK